MSEQQLERQAKHRLAVIRHAQEVTGNVAQTCRYYGISRQTYYRWLRRYEDKGLPGLRDRSKRPLVSPRATPAEIVTKIVYLRQNYHFGPRKIEMYLKRYHDITMSVSGIWRILKRLDLNPPARLAALQAPRQQVEALREGATRPPGPDRRSLDGQTTYETPQEDGPRCHASK